MKIHKDHLKMYNELKDKMLFACCWSPQKSGKYKSTTFNPFIALEKVNNQGFEAYEGVLLDACRVSPKNSEMQIVIGNNCCKPKVSLKNDDNEIFVSNDLDLISKKFLERWQK